ncbi:MAG TPA: hypothetical protein VH436_04860 [Vicinamibacterales bacterium]
MDGRTDPLNDAAVDREIESLFEVDPSSDFVARVRSRVADESMSAGWGWRWPMAAAATTVAVAVIAAMVGTVLWQPVKPTGPLAPQLTASVEGRVLKLPPNPDLVPPHVVSGVAPRRSIDIALPPVIIAANETRAFAVLVRTAPNTQFDFVAAAAAAMTPVEVDKMPAIEPIVIKPLAGDTAE